MSAYELYLGDCLEVMPTLPDASCDAIICDLPFGVTNCAWDSVIPFVPMWEQLKRLIKPRGAIVLFGTEPFSSLLRVSNMEWFKYDWVWEKDTGTGYLDANRKPLKYHENICVFSCHQAIYIPQRWQGQPNHSCKATGLVKINKTQRTTYRTANDVSGLKYPRSVINFRVVPPSVKRHTSEKPLDLMEYLVRTYTNEGDTALDFTMGSGSTGHACATTGRHFVGIERDAHYFDVAQRRITEAYAAPVQMELAS